MKVDTTYSPDHSEPLLRVAQVAELFGVSTRTIKNWEREGRITPIKLTARTIRYSASAVQQLVDEQSGLTTKKIRGGNPGSHATTGRQARVDDSV